MSIIKYTQFLASANYSCGTYGSGTYQGTCQGTDNNLANTGFDVLIPIFLGVSIIIASGILLVRRAMRKRKSQQPAL